MVSAALTIGPNGSRDIPESGCASDRELLQRFLTGEDAAFSRLVQRHAGMVINLCQRILQQPSDAEDAFQATFLVLARKARSLEWHVSIAGWLHQTARRTALKLRSMQARRREVEGQVAQQQAAVKSADPVSQVAMREFGEILDQELAGLSDRFREVILLCQVEGLTRDEAAERLRVTVATVKDRLERGRELLRSRLLRRGVTLTSAAFAAWLIPGTAQAAGLPTLATSTSQAAGAFATGSLAAGTSPAAASLAQGVIHMMGFEKLKYAAAWLVSLLTVGGIAFGMLRDEPQRFDKGLRGEVVAVNLSGSIPTVTVKLEGEVLLNLDIDPQTKVWTAFEAGKLADLRPERYVSLRLGADHRTVQEIHVLGMQREVTIRSVEPSGKIIAVEGYWDEGDEHDDPLTTQEFQLAQDAILRINDLPATTDDLKPGMKVPLEFSSDGKKVNAIEADGDYALVLSGEILSVQLTEQQIKVRVWGEDLPDEGQELTLSLLTDTLILLDGKPAALEALQPRGEITVRLHDTRTSIRALRATTPEPEEMEDVSAESEPPEAGDHPANEED